MSEFEDTDEPNRFIGVGHAFTEKGVYLLVQTPEGEWKPVLRVEPEFARRIAMNLTISSYKCEDLRREKM